MISSKTKYIAEKIKKIVQDNPNMPKKQAVAIAYSMYENIHGNGGYQLPEYQTAGTYNFSNTFPGSNFTKPKFSADPNIATPEQFSEQMNKITEVNPGKYGLGKDPNYVSPLSEESLTAGEDFKKRTDEMGKAAGLPQDFSKNIFGETTTQNTEDKSKVAPPDIKGGEPFQFFNPYSGFDIPTAASTLGSSIESGDTLGTVASGLKLATGLARNFFGGMGQERRKNYLQKEYYDKQREGMTGAGREQMLEFGGYYQEGGEEEYEEDEVYGDLINKYPNRNPNTNKAEDVKNKTDWYEEGMDRDTYYGFKNELESLGYKSVPKEVSEDKDDKNEQKEKSYDKNSARDTWVAKTGLPWSEAKRLGYTDGSAKDNMKLLSELNDPRFKKEYLRKRPLSPAKSKVAEDNKTYYGGTLKEVVIEAPRKKAGASRFMFTSDKAYQDYLKTNKMKAPDTNTGMLVPMPAFYFSPKQKEQPMFRQAYQDGGEQQVAQQVAQAMQKGMQPQEAMSMLMESGMTEDQALQMVQAIIEQLQQQTETPQLRKGGEMIKRADGSYSRRGLWDNIRDNIGSGKKPTKEMLEQEVKIKREYQEGGMEPGADPTEMIMQQVAQMLDQGADPQQIVQMLVEAGVPEEQAVQMVEAVMQQSEQMPEMRDGGIPERYKKMGFSKVGAKKKSTRPGKKWMVLAKKGDQYKIVHGGDSNMKDFSQHGSEKRKDRFWNRMGGRDSAKANDPFSPLYWHKRFGTWQEGGEMMDEEMEGEDETMENESAMLEQIESQVEQALKQGADPQQIMEQLIQMGIPQEVAQQMIEEILQEIEGGETEMEEPEEGTPQMSKGGKYMRALVGKTIKNYKYNPKTDSYIVSYE